eukprot:TRINITY_DN25050_c0_g1_i1.p1 TRINITY_DN25050_c0_g1~~TRINITY_DN25050_c0_g1_i1.p1  ORF type:complete len:102 (+),score=29.85 TRINITY_DN25050_c0_g1_i1:46-351(+)
MPQGAIRKQGPSPLIKKHSGAVQKKKPKKVKPTIDKLKRAFNAGVVSQIEHELSNRARSNSAQFQLSHSLPAAASDSKPSGPAKPKQLGKKKHKGKKPGKK